VVLHEHLRIFSVPWECPRCKAGFATSIVQASQNTKMTRRLGWLDMPAQLDGAWRHRLRCTPRSRGPAGGCSPGPAGPPAAATAAGDDAQPAHEAGAHTAADEEPTAVHPMQQQRFHADLDVTAPGRRRTRRQSAWGSTSTGRRQQQRRHGRG
jgi:hypothetical protein